ncbi:hypothetical protein [Nocardia blacklockiae]|uniref:hypothetical protein n=1 Tax=Nocardia blacklockiae TaxID=480036 RepID=UPI0018949256|nr:hypothetical protein [Nocardia blacklockiae]MBF6172963.1 hypothetical protein [Nocardia blacklockiae]
MGIVATDWLITSDVALEVAFRIDLPGPDRGRWVVSYLPADRRFTRDQALAGVVLAEMVMFELPDEGGDWDSDVASVFAAELGLSLTEALCLLALRAAGITADDESGEDGEAPEPESVPPCTTGAPR